MTMSAEERIAVLETKVEAQKATLDDIDKKLDTVLAAMNMGRGAWWAAMKIGGTLLLIFTAAGWLVSQLGSIWQHLWR